LAGGEWHTDIQDHFKQWDIICFMVSPNLMKTKYIHEYEIKKAFERKSHDANFKIVPIIIDFCQWTTEKNNLGKFTALPYTAKPVASFHNQNEAWYIVQACLRLMIEKNLDPTSDDFYEWQPLPKDIIEIYQRIKGKVDANT
jgi:internalin A